MDEKRAREILGFSVTPEDELFELGWYIAWPSAGPDKENASLDGYFTADHLEAIAWWMRNK